MISHNYKTLIYLTVLLFTLSTVSSHADKLILFDGSQLFGQVMNKEPNTITFKTTYAGTLKIKWDTVKQLHTDKALILTV